MLKLLRYVNVTNGGYVMRHAISPDDFHSFGATPQEAYDAIPYWTFGEADYAEWLNPPECRLQYEHVEYADPDEQWSVRSAWEPVLITPSHQGCLAASGGMLKFDAVDLRERDEEGNPVEDEFNTYVFAPLCTTVSSGTNTFVLSSGIFASWGYGSASNVGGPDTAPSSYILGWQARNVKVIYDYESNFNFKQGN